MEEFEKSLKSLRHCKMSKIHFYLPQPLQMVRAMCLQDKYHATQSEIVKKII